jgi:hypothetical protein
MNIQNEIHVRDTYRVEVEVKFKEYISLSPPDNNPGR